jgi:hypothetical protein
MSSGLNKLVRTAGQKCVYCCQSNEDMSPLLTCSGCNTARYCNKECQKNHWKVHKILCNRARKFREEGAAVYGGNFIDYVDRWRNQHEKLICSLARIRVGSLSETHALILSCDYTENMDRNKRALIQIQGTEVYSSCKMVEIFGPTILDVMIQLRNGTTLAPEATYYPVLCSIENKDAKKTMDKISIVGFPKNQTPSFTAEQCISAINVGDYEALRSLIDFPLTFSRKVK